MGLAPAATVQALGRCGSDRTPRFSVLAARVARLAVAERAAWARSNTPDDTGHSSHTCCRPAAPLAGPMHGLSAERRPGAAPQGAGAPPGQPRLQPRSTSRPMAGAACRPRRRRHAAAVAGGSGGDAADGDAATAAATAAEAFSASAEAHTAEAASAQPAAQVRGVLYSCAPPPACRSVRSALAPAHMLLQATQQQQAAAVAPQPASLSSMLAGPPAAGPFGPTTPLGGPAGSGWVWAAAVLLAARLGRVTAQEARLDVRSLQVGCRGSRSAAAGGPAVP